MSILPPQVKYAFAMLYSDLITNSYGESGTHLVENHDFQSRTESPINPKLKMLWPLCNQTINLETDSKTLYYSILKLKDSPPV